MGFVRASWITWRLSRFCMGRESCHKMRGTRRDFYLPVWVRWKRLDAVSEAFTQWREWFVMIAGMLLITKTLPAAFGTVQTTKQAVDLPYELECSAYLLASQRSHLQSALLNAVLHASLLLNGSGSYVCHLATHSQPAVQDTSRRVTRANCYEPRRLLRHCGRLSPDPLHPKFFVLTSSFLSSRVKILRMTARSASFVSACGERHSCKSVVAASPSCRSNELRRLKCETTSADQFGQDYAADPRVSPMVLRLLWVFLNVARGPADEGWPRDGCNMLSTRTVRTCSRRLCVSASSSTTTGSALPRRSRR